MISLNVLCFQHKTSLSSSYCDLKLLHYLIRNTWKEAAKVEWGTIWEFASASHFIKVQNPLKRRGRKNMFSTQKATTAPFSVYTISEKTSTTSNINKLKHVFTLIEGFAPKWETLLMCLYMAVLSETLLWSWTVKEWQTQEWEEDPEMFFMCFKACEREGKRLIQPYLHRSKYINTTTILGHVKTKCVCVKHDSVCRLVHNPSY